MKPHPDSPSTLLAQTVDLFPDPLGLSGMVPRPSPTLPASPPPPPPRRAGDGTGT